MPMVDRANLSTVQPLRGRLVSAAGDLYPHGLCREYIDPEAS